MTPAEIIYHRRVQVLAHAEKSGNVAETCRTFGISRTRYYQWRNLADAYGLEALILKDRRRPQLPNATPTWVINELLTMTVTEPTIGCRQYADRLAERGYAIAKSTVQKVLVDHGLGRRAQRVARAAAITAAVEAGLNVQWFSIEDLGALVRRHRIDDSITKAFTPILRAQLVIVDDIGLLPISADAPKASTGSSMPPTNAGA